ncbi:MAG TPA: DUF1223 domain-containing protein [Anaeromyxobacteraceae bacterium]|nr:DUF1223 domain-containing protein [Anaeromyxobacteraceae bacterium]
MKRMLAFLVLATATRAAAAPQPAAVLVELFTSEGCSSCPPADALLKRLAAEQPVPGARIIALSEHVDYWDDLGWRDAFSGPVFTRRQLAYARRLRTSTYTPQMIVAGAHAFVGSDGRSAAAAVQSARDEPAGEVSARWRPEGGGAIEVSARWPDHVEAQVLVAFVQNHATSRVARGENAGRTLEHIAVVRELSVAGTGAGTFSGRVTSPAPAGADRAVVFVQARDGGRIHGVAEVELQHASDVLDHPHGAWR